MKHLLTTVLTTLVLACSVQAQGADDTAPMYDHTALVSGKQVYTYWCSACHDAGKPGAVAIAALHKGKLPAVLEERKDLSVDYVKLMVRNGRSIMPFFRKTQITDSQLEALASYLAKPAN